MNRSFSLSRSTPLRSTGGSKRKTAPKRKPISPASPEQRAKVREQACVVTGAQVIEGAIVDPAHLCPRSHGGCDDPLCVIPLVRHYHRDFNDGRFDLLPHLRPHHAPDAYLPEIQHALAHYEGNLIALLERLTNVRWRPVTEPRDRGGVK